MIDRAGRSWRVLALFCILVLIVIGGCASQPVAERELADPLEPVNRAMFEFNKALGKWVLRPVTTVYTKVMPDDWEKGVSNFFRNTGYLHVIANDLLQGEMDWAWRDTQRLFINTTIGVLGVLDPATKRGFAYREQNFGVTAAKWGWKPGPYLVLPLLGPHTFSSLPDIPLRLGTNPIFYLDAGLTQTMISGLGMVDSAASQQQNIERVDQAVNPYVFMKQGYTERQLRLILGEDRAPAFEPLPDDLMDEPATQSTDEPPNPPAP